MNAGTLWLLLVSGFHGGERWFLQPQCVQLEDSLPSEYNKNVSSVLSFPPLRDEHSI